MKEISIVIVDDDPEFSASVKMFFEGERGYSVAAVAATGKEGVEAILDSRPDVVLLDMILPETDGGLDIKEVGCVGQRDGDAIAGDQFPGSFDGPVGQAGQDFQSPGGVAADRAEGRGDRQADHPGPRDPDTHSVLENVAADGNGDMKISRLSP